MTPSDGARMADQHWTIGRLLDWTAKFLAEKGAETPRLDAEVLLAHVCQCRRIELYVRHDETASEPARTQYRELIRRRIEGCPVAYLVGRKEFFSLELEVSSATLIPRPDTETLVTTCLEFLKDLAAPTILDVGTGSGNVAIALARRLPSARLHAIDVSPEALAVARRNAAKHGVEDRITFMHSDLFAALDPDAHFHAIVSNPPYVAREDLPRLPFGVRQYEPMLALDGGPGGYEVIKRLVAKAPRHLDVGGCLIVEIGTAQESPVRALMTEAGFEVAPTIYDYSRHPRVVKGRRPA